MTDVPMLHTAGLVSGYGRQETLHGVEVEVPKGKLTTVIGPNGSGKSTLLKTVAGLLRTWRGTTLLDGENVAGKPAHALVRRGLCMVPQGRVVFPFLTVEENLRMCGYTVRADRDVRQRINQSFEFFPVLAERRRQLANTLSGGEQVMLSIAKVVMLRPRLLLLDEPSLGLAPRLVEQVRDIIVQINQQGTSVLLIEQNAVMALAIANSGYVLETGKVVKEGLAADLLADEDIREFYLGSSERRSFADIKSYRRRKRWSA
jgi:branched-chain amino acid transport system ATP-binding protein